MAKVAVKALRTDTPGNSLAVWLAMHHPDLFLATFKQAQSANMAKGMQKLGVLAMGRLADDGVTTTFDVSPSDTSFAASSFDPTAGLNLAPVYAEPGLETVTIDTAAAAELPSNFLSDAFGSGVDALANIASGGTSSGNTLGGTLAGVGTGLLGALGSVGTFLGNNVTNLTKLASSYFGAQAATTNAQTQQAVLQTQIARASAGQTAAPIRYTTNAQGQLVPVYSTQTANGAVYQPLSSAGLASLTPSGFTVFLSRYGLPLGIGAAVLFFALSQRR